MASTEISTSFPPAPERCDPEVRAFFEKKEIPRFFLVEHVENWVETYNSTGSNWTKFLESCAKVTTVFTMGLSILMPLAIYYLPAWAPWGVGLPSILLLSLVTAQLRARVEGYERDNEFVPFLKSFLDNRSFRSLHPVGGWDLASTDKRLRSNRIADNELKNRKLESAREIEEGIGIKSRDKGKLPDLKYDTPDIDVTPLVQTYAACRFADISKREEKWARVKQAQSEAAGHLRSGNLEQFEKKRAEAVKTAYCDEEANETSFNPVYELPSLSVRGRLESVARLHRAFCQLFPRVEKLYEEGKALYIPCKFLGEEEKTCKDWENFVRISHELKAAIAPLEKLLAKQNPSAKKLLSELVSIEEKGVNAQLYFLLAQTEQIEEKLKNWVALHPLKRVASIEETFKKYETEKVLNQEERTHLALWLEGHRTRADTRIVDLPERIGLTKQFKAWVERYPTLKFQSVTDVFNLACEMGRKLEEAKQKFSELKAGAAKITASEEAYTAFAASLTQFEKEVLAPATLFIETEGQTSKLQIIVSSLFSRDQTLPFPKEDEPLPNDPILRKRKIEEIRLDRLLEQADTKMVNTNRVRLCAVRIPLILLFAVEGIFSIYFASPWFFWGCCFLAAAGEGLSYYINYRLEKMEREKQAIRLQQILRDHPDIGQIPGNRPKLRELKTLQQNYNLEGVRPTWARTLAEGENILPEPKDLESAKGMIKKIAKEGSQQAHAHLENILLPILSNKFRGVDPKSQRGMELGERIQAIKEAIKEPEEEKKAEALFVKAEPSLYEQAVIKRNEIDAEMDKIAEEMIGLQRKKADYLKAAKRFDYLEKRIAFWKSREAVNSDKIELLVQAEKENCPRTSTEDVRQVLADATPILDEINRQGRSDENMERLAKGPFARLCALPAVLLRLQREKLEQMLPKAVWSLKKLHDDKSYVSKEGVEAKIKEGDEKLKTLQLQIEEKKKLYDEANLEVVKHRPAEIPSEQTAKERLEEILQQATHDAEARKEITELYLELNEVEKRLVWWHLPSANRAMFNGENLLAYCCQMSASGTDLAAWWDEEQEQTVKLALAQIEAQHLLATYSFLPDFFKAKLKSTFEALTGEDLINYAKLIETEVAKVETSKRALTRAQIWENEQKKILDRFLLINPYHHGLILEKMPAPIRKLFDSSYKKYTGSRLISFCSAEYNKIKNAAQPERAFKSWWGLHGQKVVEHYKKISPNLAMAVLDKLPPLIKNRISQEQLSSLSLTQDDQTN